MGHLVQPISTEAHPVRRARSAWRLVPVALGTAAALAGCGAGGHHATGVAAVSPAREHPAVSHRAARDAVSSAHKHAAVSHRTARDAVSSTHKHATITHRAARHAVSSTHKHPAISHAAATGQTAAPASAGAAPGNLVPGAGAAIGAQPGSHVTVRHSSAKRSGADARNASPQPVATNRVITGTGNAGIGTVAEGSSVLLTWTASKGPIQIFTSQGNLLLSSGARHGSIRLAKGQYQGLRVASPGAWTLRLHPAV
jgi:hypothetical protein